NGYDANGSTRLECNVVRRPEIAEPVRQMPPQQERGDVGILVRYGRSARQDRELTPDRDGQYTDQHRPPGAAHPPVKPWTADPAGEDRSEEERRSDLPGATHVDRDRREQERENVHHKRGHQKVVDRGRARLPGQLTNGICITRRPY